MSNWYIYDENHVPVKSDAIEACTWLGQENRKIVKQETINGHFVSTVFLGLDHSWLGQAPLLWETMIFSNSDLDQYQERYSSYEDALKGHEEALKLASKQKLFGEEK
jgi:prephenate dehydrogenase